MYKHTIVIGDSRRLSLMKDKSVQLIITSPPYWQLKDYGADSQIGFNDSYENYINNLNLVWQECYRVLSDGCRMCINIGDQFARSVYYGRYKVIPIRTEIIRFCEALGMDYMGAVIWQKATNMNTTGGGAVMGSFPYPRNGILKIDYEFILIFKKLGLPTKPTPEQKELSIIDKDEWNTFFSSHWNFSGVRQQGHLAMFPEELPRRLIKMFSFVGETVFDPFLGSGTTSLAARNLARNSVGYEINKEFLPIISDKLGSGENQPNEHEVRVVFDKSNSIAVTFDKLPYIFKDPHGMNKKVDVKKLTFGSKIDTDTPAREELFSVKRVISPELIQLANDLTVRLIGVKTNPASEQEAVDYLTGKFTKHKVMLRYDHEKYDSENTLRCYVYLDNKTFVNVHLLRSGFVLPDTLSDYKYKSKFLEVAASE